MRLGCDRGISDLSGLLTHAVAARRPVDGGDEPRRKHALVRLLRARFQPTDAVIIYCTRQMQVDNVTSYLQAQGIAAVPYHAGRTPADRANAQVAFLTGTAPVVVATIAFGLGIDKANVRGVVHFNLPKSLDNYVQVRRRRRRVPDAAGSAWAHECVRPWRPRR